MMLSVPIFRLDAQTEIIRKLNFYNCLNSDNNKVRRFFSEKHQHGIFE